MASVIGIISTNIEDAGGYSLHFILTLSSIIFNVLQIISLLPE